MPKPSTPVDFTKSLDNSNLKGKTALVTGGASGIGAGVVRALAEAGVNVTIADRNATAGEQYAYTLTNEGHKVLFLETDVTDWHAQVQAFKKTIQHTPMHKIDIVIACAGIAGASMLQDSPFTASDISADPLPPLLQHSMINVNLIGPMYTATLAAHYWRQNPRTLADDNVLVMVASNIAYYPTPGFTGYTASRWGIRGMWKALLADPQLQDVLRTNLLAPHIVRSPMTAGLQPLLDANGLKMTEVSDCVDVLMRFCLDPEITGRAVQVNPEGSQFDLHDDEEGLDGSKVFHEHHLKETKDLFDFINNPNLSMS